MTILRKTLFAFLFVVLASLLVDLLLFPYISNKLHFVIREGSSKILQATHRRGTTSENVIIRNATQKSATPTNKRQTTKVLIQTAPRGSGARKFELELIAGQAIPSKNYGELPKHFQEPVPEKKPSQGFIHRPWILENSKNRFLMVTIVKTTCQSFEKRKLLRNTWGAVKAINSEMFGLLFVMGLSPNNDTQVPLDDESSKYGDILQARVSDNYKNLPEKVLSAYQWIYEEWGNRSEFYTFTDDDCILNLPRIYDYLTSNRETFINDKKIYCGFQFDTVNIPRRNIQDQYHVSHNIYPHNVFPPFCHGGMSTLGFPILSDLYQMAKVTNRFGLHLEDVYITGILRSKLNRGHQNIKPLSYDGAKHKFDYHMGPFSWHLGANHVKNLGCIWRIILNLMSFAAGNNFYSGFWPSSKELNATLTENVMIPDKTIDLPKFFEENFASIKYLNT